MPGTPMPVATGEVTIGIRGNSWSSGDAGGRRLHDIRQHTVGNLITAAQPCCGRVWWGWCTGFTCHLKGCRDPAKCRIWQIQ